MDKKHNFNPHNTVDYNVKQIITRTSANNVIKEGYIARQMCGFIWQYDL